MGGGDIGEKREGEGRRREGELMRGQPIPGQLITIRCMMDAIRVGGEEVKVVFGGIGRVWAIVAG